MCLYNAKVIKPEEDLICYKIFRRNQRNNRLTTFFNKFIVHENTPLRAFCADEDFIKEHRGHMVETFNGHPVETFDDPMRETYSTYSGVFHCFAEQKDALHFLKTIIPNFYQNCLGDKSNVPVVHKCVIPKESRVVFEGYYDIMPDLPSKSYASSHLIVKEEIGRNEHRY